MKCQNTVKGSTTPTASRKTEGHLEIFFYYYRRFNYTDLRKHTHFKLGANN